MLDELQLLRGEDFIINNYITVHHPSLREICDIGEEKYLSTVSIFTATPTDYKVQLYDIGVDYSTISDFELFCILTGGIKDIEVTSLLFGGVDFSNMKVFQDKENGEIVLCDVDNFIRLDKFAYLQISDFLRSIHFFEKNVEKPGNERSKKYFIERDRRKLERERNKPFKSMMKPLISALVNCEHFKYNYETIWDLPVYAFHDSVRQIQKLKSYNNLMSGIYTGNIDMTKVSEKDMNWIRFNN